MSRDAMPALWARKVLLLLPLLLVLLLLLLPLPLQLLPLLPAKAIAGEMSGRTGTRE